MEIVVSSWCSTLPSGSADIVFKNKLKRLKEDIKKWAIKKKENQLKEKKGILNKLQEWDEKAEAGQIKQ